MNKFFVKSLSILSLVGFLFPLTGVQAQQALPAGPVYIVQEGDSLWEIAYRFHVSQDELASANGILDPDQISIGQSLIIPGLDGIQGILTTQTVQYGESLHSLSVRYKLSSHDLKRLNHLTSPEELYAGYSLVIPQNDALLPMGKRATLTAGQSTLELAILNDTDPWTILTDNTIDNSWAALPGQVLRLPGEDDFGPGALPASVTSVNITQLVQGQAAEIQVTGSKELSPRGSFIDHPLNFFPNPEGYFIALQGIYAMAEPGLYPLTLQVPLDGESTYNFSQMVVVFSGDFPYDRTLPVDPATLDPDTNRTENELWFTAASKISPVKMWSGNFYLPVDPVFGACYTSRFGNRRSYNGGEYLYFHTGLDFCGQVGDPIYAAATGTVVFAGALTVRGQATMIDHGMGVFSAYMHQSEILVNVGDKVEEGQLIGKVGNTGRVEGPHLHFEVLVGGVQVDPLQWLDGEFP